MQTLGPIARELTALGLASHDSIGPSAKELISKAKVVIDREIGEPSDYTQRLIQLADTEPFLNAHAVQASTLIQAAAREIVRKIPEVLPEVGRSTSTPGDEA